MHAAEVRVHGLRVGVLTRVSDDEDFEMVFDPGWAADPRRPVLGQQFEDLCPEPLRSSGLPSWFAHLLPQGPWRGALRQLVGRAAEPEDDLLDLLAIGADLPGAVTLRPLAPAGDGPRGRRAPVRAAEGARFSLAGAQAKISARRGARGLVLPVADEVGQFIAKFDDPRFPGLPRLELATTRWAAAAGLRAHTVELVPVDAFEGLPEGIWRGSGEALLLTRFDRSAEGLVHVEDFGQLTGRPPGDPGQYTGSAEDLGRVLGGVVPRERREAELMELVDRLAFAVVCGNGDAHLKNWGVWYPDRRAPALSPAYDLVSTVAVMPGDDLALSLAGRRRFEDIDAEAFADLGRALGLDPGAVAARARAQAQAAREAWRALAPALDLRPVWRERLAAHLERVPLR